MIAPPGAGKSTTLPLLAYLHGAGRVVVLQPRRVAAVSTAQRLAALLGEEVGQRVGYAVKGSVRLSEVTQLVVVTDGVLLQELVRSTPRLAPDVIFFDEFHERGITSDLCLGLVLRSAAVGSPTAADDASSSPKVVVMSATLDDALVDRLTVILRTTHGVDPYLVRVEGRTFPVRVEYVGHPGLASSARDLATVAAVQQAVTSTSAAVLVFLPGVAEINRIAHALRASHVGADVDVIPLHGGLPPAEQAAVVRGDAERGSSHLRRRIILATSVAEASITVPDVEAVVDVGLARVSRFDPKSGLDRLQTVPASIASVEQRAGRAGRMRPGVAYRLWNKGLEVPPRPSAPLPQVVVSDVSGLALALAAVGDPGGCHVPWVDAPPPPALARARRVLRRVGAFEDSPTAQGGLSPRGRLLVEVGAPPRLASIVVAGLALECCGRGGGTITAAFPLPPLAVACVLAAILMDRDVVTRGRAPPPSDLAGRVVGCLLGEDEPSSSRSKSHDPRTRVMASVHPGARRRVLQEAARLERGIRRAVGRLAQNTETDVMEKSDERRHEGWCLDLVEVELEEGDQEERDGVGMTDVDQDDTDYHHPSSSSSTCWAWIEDYLVDDRLRTAAVFLAGGTSPDPVRDLVATLLYSGYPDRVMVQRGGRSMDGTFTLPFIDSLEATSTSTSTTTTTSSTARCGDKEDPVRVARVAVGAAFAGQKGGTRGLNVALAGGWTEEGVEAVLVPHCVAEGVAYWVASRKEVRARVRYVLDGVEVRSDELRESVPDGVRAEVESSGKEYRWVISNGERDT